VAGGWGEIAKMLIGLDFGSHHSSLGLWIPETGLVQVFADDMGSRHIPCIVGFRRDEVLVGHSALVQRHKNHANTFDNIRKLLENESTHEIYVPVLEKSLTVIELASHYFRHIYNQVKDQIGKQVKDCVMTIPLDSSELLKSNLIEAARGGGLKIRSFVHDSVAAPLAHRLDDVGQDRAVVIVVDFGWSKCEISCLEVVSGVLAPLSNNVSKNVCGATFVDALTKHCAKDFQRRAKFSCLDNTRSMMRLTTECESAIKILSTSAEAAIDLDSLCEGVDYAGKISRVRFEDLCLTSFMSLRELIQSSIAQAIATYAEWQLGEISADSFTHIILAGSSFLFSHLLIPGNLFRRVQCCPKDSIHSRNSSP
jgi:heat shock 70kDa protein 1/2/6/8